MASERMFNAYVECALWSSTTFDDELDFGTPMDELDADISPATLAEMRADVDAFATDNADDLANLDAEQAGHDFWLTRNGHGAGFWDRGLGAVGDRLTAAAHVYGSVDLYVGDDGLIYA